LLCSPPQRQRALGFGDRRSAEQASADLETMAAAGSSPSSSSSKRCVPCSFLHPLSLHGSRAWVPCSSTPPSMASLVLCSTARLLLQLKPCLLKTRPIMQDLDQSFPFLAAKCDESEDPPSQSTVLFLVECDAMAEKLCLSFCDQLFFFFPFYYLGGNCGPSVALTILLLQTCCIQSIGVLFMRTSHEVYIGFRNLS
jgi:hypothetical protein